MSHSQYPAFLRKFKKPVFRCIEFLPDYPALKLQGLIRLRYWMNLKNPQSISEKINWRKLYQRDPRIVDLSDKIKVKSFIEATIGAEYVIPTLWTGTDPLQMPLKDLPLPFVVKTNHSCGDTILVRTPADLDDVKAIQDQMAYHLAHKHSYKYREWGYYGIKPAILIEEMIGNGSPPEDYKFWVFHGKVQCVGINIDRFGRNLENWVDRDGKALDLKKTREASHDFQLPESFPKMVTIAEKLGAEFDFVRVDLYSVNNTISFGEMSFYPGAGMNPYSPREWDYKLGSYWTITPAA